MKNNIVKLWKVPEIRAYLIANLIFNLASGWFFGIYTIFLTRKIGLDLAQANLVNVVFMTLSTLFDPYTGSLADKFGQKKVYIWGQVWWAAGMLVYGFANGFWLAILAESMAAIGHALMSQALETWLRNRLGEDLAHEAISFEPSVRMANVPSAIAGSIIGAIIGLEWPWRLAGVMGLVGSIVTYRVMKKLKDEGDGQNEVSLRQVFKLIARNKSLRGYLTRIFLYSALVQPINMYWSIILSERAGSFAWLGSLWIPISILTALGGQIAGKRKDLKLTIAITALPIMLAGVSDSLWLILIGFLVHEIGRGMIFPIVFSLSNRHINDNIRSTASSTIMAGKTAGGVVGLLISGWLTYYFKPLTIWLVAGVGLAILAIKTKTDPG